MTKNVIVLIAAFAFASNAWAAIPAGAGPMNSDDAIPIAATNGAGTAAGISGTAGAAGAGAGAAGAGAAGAGAAGTLGVGTIATTVGLGLGAVALGVAAIANNNGSSTSTTTTTQG